MNIFTITAPMGDQIVIRYAAGSNQIEANDKIKLIKIVRDTTSCGLKDAKDFVDLLLNELNKLTPSVDRLRRDIIAEIDNIYNTGDLLDIKRFVNTCKAYPVPSRTLGSFDHDGSYNPKPQF